MKSRSDKPVTLLEVTRGWESFDEQYWLATEHERTPTVFGQVHGQFEELGYWTEVQLNPSIKVGKL